MMNGFVAYLASGILLVQLVFTYTSFHIWNKMEDAKRVVFAGTPLGEEELKKSLKDYAYNYVHANFEDLRYDYKVDFIKQVVRDIKECQLNGSI